MKKNLKKLVLAKETLRRLEAADLPHARGGYPLAPAGSQGTALQVMSAIDGCCNWTSL
jgi:hypothetical protein